MHLLTEWEGWRGKYWARGRRTNRAHGREPKYFPHARPNSVNIKYFITPPFLSLVVLEYFEKLPVNTHSINRASALNEQMEFVGPEGFFRTGLRQPTGP